MFAMVKAFVPRYRYDQLMRIGWKVFLPASLVMVIVAAHLQVTGWGRHETAERWRLSPCSPHRAPRHRYWRRSIT